MTLRRPDEWEVGDLVYFAGGVENARGGEIRTVYSVRANNLRIFLSGFNTSLPASHSAAHRVLRKGDVVPAGWKVKRIDGYSGLEYDAPLRYDKEIANDYTYILISAPEIDPNAGKRAEMQRSIEAAEQNLADLREQLEAL